MNPDDELRRAAEAKRLMDEPLFKAAREDVYAQLKAARSAAPTLDAARCADVVRLEQIADRFFGYFEQLAQTGQMAQIFEDQQARQRKSFADRMLAYATLGRAGL